MELFWQLLFKDILMTGVEIDPEQLSKCINRLNEIVKQNGILSVSWNIFRGDYLRMEDTIHYDFVVGNPPYITYSELKKKIRSI